MSYFHAVSLYVNRVANQSLPRTRSGKRTRTRVPSLPCITEEDEHQHLLPSSDRVEDKGASTPSYLKRCGIFLNPCSWRWERQSSPSEDSITPKQSQSSCCKEEQTIPVNSRAALEYFPVEDDEEDSAESSSQCAVLVMREESSGQWPDALTTNTFAKFNQFSAAGKFASIFSSCLAVVWSAFVSLFAPTDVPLLQVKIV
mmetsp:Transcript_25662/g.44202  ORF Transcript_25662/g.44202 Transcript_25662/m.44202 type:complete len:200 (+) Transcript_25662:190-789(+)|eukprot:CAMPEP_0196660096 /NCGR_PEP_ID=MMETSP1086-20130531/38074_1 /TAXON_ID=77921 /ORGANISM="Cyanoptyche  gloeocystis , Strain SAG4.97" /LENGTH=199 /DNA_ID=CAMNT_0041994347 /DNA_START=173 /DNA_END=772 /DNA_ORIENTATION=-